MLERKIINSLGMKKKTKQFIGFLGAACLVFSLAACKNDKITSEANAATLESRIIESIEHEASVADEQLPSESQKADNEPQNGKSDIMVAYFSATGSTRGVAEKIATATGGDIYEIVPAKAYTAEDLDYHNSQSRTSLEMEDVASRPEIGGETISLDGYSTLYLGYPIWHGQAPRIMSTFVENHDFDGITVIPFCTSGGSGIASSGSQLGELAGSGTWITGERFNSNVSDTSLKAWIDSLE